MAKQLGGRQYINYTFYKFLPSWYLISKNKRKSLLESLEKILNKYNKKITLNSYSTFGVRAECDFMFWKISEKIENFETMSSDILKTGLGGYIQTK